MKPPPSAGCTSLDLFEVAAAGPLVATSFIRVDERPLCLFPRSQTAPHAHHTHPRPARGRHRRVRCYFGSAGRSASGRVHAPARPMLFEQTPQPPALLIGSSQGRAAPRPPRHQFDPAPRRLARASNCGQRVRARLAGRRRAAVAAAQQAGVDVRAWNERPLGILNRPLGTTTPTAGWGAATAAAQWPHVPPTHSGHPTLPSPQPFRRAGCLDLTCLDSHDPRPTPPSFDFHRTRPSNLVAKTNHASRPHLG